MRPPVRAILLDFDGTLVDSEPLHYDCWMETIRPYGGHMSWGEYQRRLTGITDRQAGRILSSEAGHDPTAELIARLTASKSQTYCRRFSAELEIDLQVISWLQQQSLNLSLAIVSSSLVSEVEPLLIRVGVRELFRFLVCGDHVGKHKPDPEPYHLALKLLNQNGITIDPAECVAFEDSNAGVTAAQRAGLHVRRVRTPADLPRALREEVGE